MESYYPDKLWYMEQSFPTQKHNGQSNRKYNNIKGVVLLVI